MPSTASPRRQACSTVLTWLFLAVLTVSAYAHEGHDHGVPQTPLATSHEPRVEAASGKVTLVGILKGQRLWLYVDRTDSNAPVSNLTLQLDLGTASYNARAERDGVYSVDLPGIDKPGQYDITFTLHHHDFDDLLIGRLDVPAPAATAPSSSVPLPLFPSLFYILAAFAAVYMASLLLRRRSGTTRQTAGAPLLQVALIIALALTTATAMDKKSAPQISHALTNTADDLVQRPVRLADGSVAIPKPAQRVLTIRTVPARIAAVSRTYVLNGQVVQNPYSNAAVQAEQTGRLEPPPQGFPPVGTRVKKDQLLAYLLPTMTPLELARRDSDLRGLERDRYLTKRAYERVKTQMGTTDISASVMLETNRAQLLAFDKQIRALTDIPAHRLPVTAPMDGVIGVSSASTARIVRPGDDLFRIWDPKANWVEATSFETGLEKRIVSAVAVLNDGHRIPLTYTGQGYLLRNQGVPLQFRPSAAADALLVDQLVKVYIESNDTLQGIRIPHDSVISRGDSDPFVWIHSSPERFEPRTVSVTPLDNNFDVITAGVKPEEHLVVAGASLISHVQ